MTGLTISKYRIVEEIGRGAMGIVFRAMDTSSQREVALKIVIEKFASDPDMLSRFEREGRAAVALHHPNICSTFASGEWEGRPYLVMELLTGDTLDKRLGAGPLPADLVFDTAIGVAKALKAAHDAGIIHRDIKPANLLLTNHGVKVLDFGLAKIRTSPKAGGDPTTTTAFITKPGTLLGSLPYMAPEQIRCEPVDGRADLYALGVIIHEMATGKLPERDAGGLAPLPFGLAPVVAKLMADAPGDRYETADSTVVALEAAAAKDAFQRCGIRRALREPTI